MLKCCVESAMQHLDPFGSDLVANSKLISDKWLAGRNLNIIRDKSTNCEYKTLLDYNLIFKWIPKLIDSIMVFEASRIDQK